MNKQSLARLVPVVAALAAVAALMVWFVAGRAGNLSPRRPGADIDPANTNASAVAQFEGVLIKSNGLPADVAGAWPQFRGPNRDGISRDETALAKSWPKEGPPVLWKIDVGEGFAGAAISQGRVYLMDYDHAAQSDAFRCLSLADGRELWRYTYKVKVKRNHGMSRTVPTITARYAVALGPKCHLVCLDPATGELRWKLDLTRKFNTEVPPWYAGQCPLIDGDRLILGIGGDVLMAALDCATGETLWTTPNTNKWQMTHSSVAIVEVAGKKQYVYCASGGVVGVSADDGHLLWQTPDWKISIANVPTPLAVGEGRIFLCGGYNAGSMMLQIEEANGVCQVKTLFRLKPTVFGATQQTPILYQDHIFGVRPDGQLVCLGLDGKTVWASGPTHRFGSGPYLIAQGLIYVFEENGKLVLAEASTGAYRELASAKILQGPDAWGPMALAGGHLVLRDLNQMACLDVSAK